MHAASLWDRKSNGDEIARQQLLNENLGLVHYIARELSRGRRNEIELDELLSAGALGLTAAVDTFEPARGLAFSTFATPRIRGAILDELRRQDHVPRSVRRKTRDLRAATDALTRDGRTPTAPELAQTVGVDVETLWRWQTDVEGAVRLSLDGTTSGEDGEASPAEVLGGATDESIEDEITHSQEVDVLKQALQSLKEQERIVMSLYYYEDLKLHEIAVALGVSESRVSQIRTKALATLRGKMAPLRQGAA